MDQATLLEQLGAVGAIITGSHIVYTSGRHGSAYVNKDAAYPHVELVSEACKGIAEYFSNMEIDCVVGPAMGGIILSQWTTLHSIPWNKTPPLAIYAEKDGDGFAFHRGYEQLIAGKRVLVVEDILTTGGSVKKVIEAIRLLGGEVVGVGALCNRGGVSAEDIGGVPEIFSLLSLDLESWPEEECPLCKSDVPINTTVGKGREFLARLRS